jgi:cysteine desulfurase
VRWYNRLVGTIYLDHNATTPVACDVSDAVDTAQRQLFGNPSSIHGVGQAAKTELDDARAAVANLIGAEPAQIVFTTGGSEADNLALRGLAGSQSSRRHLVATAIEHEAVLNTLKALERAGWQVTLVSVDHTGVVDPAAVEEALTDETALVSVMHANNEIGTIQPIAELAPLVHARGALLHTDAVQSAGKLPVDVQALGVDLLSLSGHKFNGPTLRSQLTGGKQERGRRAGTENVPGLIGLGVAARLAFRKQTSETARLTVLRDRLEGGILTSVSGTQVNGNPARRVANTSNISFDGVEAESLLIALDLEGVAVSTGSACSSGTLSPSHVLRAMGFSPHRTQNSIRFSLGLGNSVAEIDRVLELLPGIVSRLRAVVGVRTPARARG